MADTVDKIAVPGAPASRMPLAFLLLFLLAVACHFSVVHSTNQSAADNGIRGLTSKLHTDLSLVQPAFISRFVQAESDRSASSDSHEWLVSAASKGSPDFSAASLLLLSLVSSSPVFFAGFFHVSQAPPL